MTRVWRLAWITVLLALSLGSARADAEIEKKLRDGLRANSPKVRIVAIARVATTKDPEARALLEPLLADRDAAVRVSVIDALGKIGDPAAVFALQKMSNDEDKTVRLVLLRVLPALKALGPPVFLDEMRRVLDVGSADVDARAAGGQRNLSGGAAPELHAGIYGLRRAVREGTDPRIAAASGPAFVEMLQLRDQDFDRRPSKALPNRRQQPTIPVGVAEAVPPRPTPDADGVYPEVKDHLMMELRERHNAMRHCYESFDITVDPSRAGRLTLALTLRPDGHIDDPVVTVDDAGLQQVGDCVEKMANGWFLGAGLVTERKRLTFPFILQPRKSVTMEMGWGLAAAVD
jgi:hypothetical protein